LVSDILYLFLRFSSRNFRLFSHCAGDSFRVIHEPDLDPWRRISRFFRCSVLKGPGNLWFKGALSQGVPSSVILAWPFWLFPPWFRVGTSATFQRVTAFWVSRGFLGYLPNAQRPFSPGFQALSRQKFFRLPPVVIATGSPKEDVIIMRQHVGKIHPEMATLLPLRRVNQVFFFLSFLFSSSERRKQGGSPDK